MSTASDIAAAGRLLDLHAARIAVAMLALASILPAGCSAARPPIQTETSVDLKRFMGDWYVIGGIPTSTEKNAYNAVESYELDEDGTIKTTFTFREGGFDGDTRRYTPRGFVGDDGSNAVWGMQFVWPIKADYRIVHVSDDYTQTVIGRQRRDYVWIMARTPSIPDADYEALVGLIGSQGYDIGRIRRVPQQWDGATRDAATNPSGSAP